MHNQINSHLPDLSRRTFLKGTAGSMAALAVASAYTLDARAQDDEVNHALDGLEYFTLSESAAVDALAEQFWPTTEDSVGGSEAGVVYYIDASLAGAYMEYQPIYRTGLQWLNQAVSDQYGAVFVDLSPDQQLTFLENILNADTSTPSAATPEAGTPSAATPEPENLGVEGVELGQGTPAASETDESASGTFEQVASSPIIAGLEGPTISSLADFLNIVRVHTMEGLFSDPVYGGNRNFAGWTAVGYGGAYYIHTEEQQTTFEPLNLPPQSIADL